MMSQEKEKRIEDLLMTTDQINGKIVQMLNDYDPIGDFDVNQISDGYHTFAELYEHRFALYVALINQFPDHAWKYEYNSDGEKYEGWFGASMVLANGKQISYHLPLRYWDKVKVRSYEKDTLYDGHTPEDVLELLSEFNPYPTPAEIILWKIIEDIESMLDEYIDHKTGELSGEHTSLDRELIEKIKGKTFFRFQILDSMDGRTLIRTNK